MMLISGVLAVFVARRRREFPELWWMVLGLAIVSSFLMFRPSAIFWRLLPKLQFVQFPWRWLDALSVPFAFFSAAALGHTRKQVASWAVILVALMTAATFMARNAWWDSDDVLTISDWVQSGSGYEGTDEYAPLGCDRYELTGVSADSEEPPQKPIAEFAQIERDSDEVVPLSSVHVGAQEWTAERRIFGITSSVPVDLAVRLLWYPAWEARIDGKKAAVQSKDHNGETVLEVPPGSHTIELSFGKTPDRAVGTVISLLFAFSLGATLGIYRNSQSRFSQGGRQTILGRCT